MSPDYEQQVAAVVNTHSDLAILSHCKRGGLKGLILVLKPVEESQVERISGTRFQPPSV